jgi:hypothetical protein
MTARQAGAAPEQTDKWKRIEDIRQRRRERGPADPLLGRLKLAIPEDAKDKDFVYRWVNDSEMRVYSMKERDWELVDDLDIAKDERNTSIGTRIERVANERTVAKPQKAYLMRKYREFFDEDERRKESARQLGEEAIMTGNLPQSASKEGRVLTEADNMYIPQEGIRIRHAGKRK